MLERYNMQTPVTETIVNAPVKVDFGAGRYSEVMANFYRDLKHVLRVESDKAEKIARQFGSDFGAAMRQSPVSVAVGKPTGKDMKGILSEWAREKGIYITKPMSLFHAIMWIAEAGKHGVSYGNTEWNVSPPLQEYIDSL